MSNRLLPAARWMNNLKSLRREAQGALDVRPAAIPDGPSGLVAPPLAFVTDYAEALNHIDAGAVHLAESLPGAQLERTVTAYLLLRAGVEELGVWLRARGVDV